MIEIIDYTNDHTESFKSLNLEWLDKYHLTEAPDIEVLNDPQSTIIDKGGYIFLAKSGNDIIGSAALLQEGHNTWELAKMAVSPAFQGKGISKLLIEKCLSKAKEMKAVKVTLFSNNQLQAALQLYRNYGFVDIPVEDSPFQTADVKMELIF